jgi:Sec-independent protein translocase protein TatA
MLFLRLIICSLHLQFIFAFLVLPETVTLVKVGRSIRDETLSSPQTMCTSCMRTKRAPGELQLKMRSRSRSAINTQLMGLFGLGGLEIAIICVGVGVVLGPQKIASLIRASGETAGEFKNELSKVPDEFQKGYEEGQVEARSRKAKPITPVDSSIDSSDVK